VLDLLAGMDSPDSSTDKLCFGVFQLDLKTGELTKRGTRLRLQGQPIRVLTLLLERSGELVTREELRQLAANSIRASFLPDSEKEKWVSRIGAIV